MTTTVDHSSHRNILSFIYFPSNAPCQEFTAERRSTQPSSSNNRV